MTTANFYFPDDRSNIGQFSGGMIDFFNASSTEIEPFSPVSITGAYGKNSWQLARYSGRCTVTAIPAADDSLPWAVTLTAAAAGGFGRAVISGIAPAYFTGEGKYVLPLAGKLLAGDTGKAQVILAPLQTDNGEMLPGALLLGGAGGALFAADEYMGIFKLRALSATTLSVIDGSAPTSPYCGYTDIPDLKQIPVLTLEVEAAGAFPIYLVFFYEASGKSYSVQLLTAVPENAVFSTLLGRFCDGSVDQVYKTADRRMVFGNDWYLL